MITGDVVPLATTHGTLVLPGIGKHEGAKMYGPAVRRKGER
jgi:hypothetical protein